MDRSTPESQGVASEGGRWLAAGAVTLSVAVYMAFHFRSVFQAVVRALGALRG